MNPLLPPPARRAALLALGLFSLLFGAQHVADFPFWPALALACGGPVAAALAYDPAARARLGRALRSGSARDLALGLGSAAVLYGVFAAGNLAVRAVWPGAAGQIARVYRVGEGTGSLAIVLWIGGVIGPAEEILWRGIIQHEASSRGRARAWLLASGLYALAHSASANPMLLLAAAVCGLFWGALYWWKRSLWLNIASHVAWDLAVFLWFPFHRAAGG